MAKKEMFEWIKTILIAVIIAFVITTFIRPTLVKGESMSPTLHNNNYLIIDKISYMMHKPEKDDIVVFKSHLKNTDGKEKDLIKRIIAVEGDEIEIDDGEIYVNGEKLEEGYTNGSYTSGEVKVKIPLNQVFVMGDNREVSVDSRDPSVGTINIDTIKGKVLIRLFPFDKIGKVD